MVPNTDISFKDAHRLKVKRHGRKKVVITFATWMNQESITLSEISKTEKDKHYVISHVEPKNNNKMNSESESSLVMPRDRVVGKIGKL